MKPQLQTINDPSLKNLDTKIGAWIISCVLLGIVACVVLPDFSNPLQNRYRTQKVRVVRGGRSYSMNRRKAA